MLSDTMLAWRQNNVSIGIDNRAASGTLHRFSGFQFFVVFYSRAV
jgi:hypothetical protein